MPPPSKYQSGKKLKNPIKVRGKNQIPIRNITIYDGPGKEGRRTSIRLETPMWEAMLEIARREGGTIHDVCTSIWDVKPEEVSLTAAIRVFAMTYFRFAATEDGHKAVEHGKGNLERLVNRAGISDLVSPSETRTRRRKTGGLSAGEDG